MQGKSTRVGVYKCRECGMPFSVKVGTVFEDCHVPLRFWLHAMHLLCSSKKGFSSAISSPHLGRHIQDRVVHVAPHPRGDGGRRWPMGGEGEIVEADETFIGALRASQKRRGAARRRTRTPC